MTGYFLWRSRQILCVYSFETLCINETFSLSYLFFYIYLPFSIAFISIFLLPFFLFHFNALHFWSEGYSVFIFPFFSILHFSMNTLVFVSICKLLAREFIFSHKINLLTSYNLKKKSIERREREEKKEVIIKINIVQNVSCEC